MIKVIIALLLLSGYAYAQETIVDTSSKSLSILNDNFKSINDNANRTRNLLNDYFANGILQTANGGTGQDFSLTSQNSIPYFSATGTMGTVGIGTTGYYLTAGSPPSWTAPIIPPHSLAFISSTLSSGCIGIGCTDFSSPEIIDTGTDWNGKNIIILGDIEITDSTAPSGSTSFSIINTSAIALSGMNFANTAASTTRFVMQSFVLSGSRNTIYQTTGFPNGNGNINMYVNGSGNLVWDCGTVGVTGGGNSNSAKLNSLLIVRQP